MKEKKLPLPQALSWIIGSIFVCSGSVYSLHTILKNTCNPSPKALAYIDKIIQTGPQRDRLSSLYLEDLLDLSIDKPTYYKDFDVKQEDEKNQYIYLKTKVDTGLATEEDK
jgi:hypothetical protein